MIIEPNSKQANTRERYRHKALIVSKHLAEFRMSSKEILASLLSQRVTSTARFFAQLEKEKIIVPFTNFHSSRRDLVRLGTNGARLVYGSENKMNKNSLRSDKFESNERVIHDLLVQTACIDVFNSFQKIVELVSDYNIQSSVKIADAYAITEMQQVLAVEVEASRKSRDRIYFTFQNYIDLINRGEVAGVAFYLLREADQKYFASLFNELVWPIYKSERSGGNLKLKEDSTLNVPIDSEVRKLFQFRLMKSSKPPLMMVDTNRVWNLPDMDYTDRLRKASEEKSMQEEKSRMEKKARDLEEQRLQSLRNKEFEKIEMQ